MLLPRAVDRTAVVCSLLFAADEVGAPRASTPPTPRDLWDLVNRQDWAICESVQRGMSSRGYRHGWFAPMEDESLDIRRWLLPRVARASAPEVRRMTERVDFVVAGLGALGSATAASSPAAATPWSGWSGSRSGTTAAPATTPAGSCGTATTRPATSG